MRGPGQCAHGGKEEGLCFLGPLLPAQASPFLDFSLQIAFIPFFIFLAPSARKRQKFPS